MKMRQISVFIENRAGRLASVARVLKEEGIDIRAMSMADAPDFGIFRIVVEEPELARAALKARGFVTEMNEVVGVEVDDRPGGLAEILTVFEQHDLNVEYMYAFQTEREDRAIVFFRFEDTDRAVETLQQAELPLVGPDRLRRQER